jgi:single-stranded-DNA-specific exonuclease
MSTSRPIVLRAAPDPRILDALSDLDPVSARLFAARGVSDPDELDYALSRLAPVGLLENVDAAVDLLVAKRGSRITIVGDFDVDGATSAVLMMRCLREFGFADVGYLVPNRFEFGYGLTPEIVRIAAESSPALLVTVDNGISSLTGVEEANRLGIPVLVTDHHLPGNELPDAAVIVNPSLPGSRFPSRNLAGVGVAFYLMAALGRRLDNEGLKNAARVPSRYLDLVALGTVADVVPLDHNNRVLVDQGLRRSRPRIRRRAEDQCRRTTRGHLDRHRMSAHGRHERCAASRSYPGPDQRRAPRNRIDDARTGLRLRRPDGFKQSACLRLCVR